MRPSCLPLVSIVIPVYNGANFMREAIDSALSQTYPNIEVIVVNDGSTDNGATHEIAMSYKDRIHYFHKENGGVSSALNHGIKQMKGEYFAWLSHDDIHLPQKVEKQMDAVFNHKGNKPIICVCNYFIIDGEGKEFARSPQDIEKYFRISPKCFLGCETTYMIDGDATLINKRVFDICGLFNESLCASQETDMWLRSLEAADFIFIPEYLVGYRNHPQQVTNRRARAVGKEAGAYRGDLIKQSTIQEIQDYFNSEKDAVRFGLSAYGYMYLYFYDASHQIIKKLRQLCSMDWKFVRDVLKGMFEYGDVDNILYVLKKEISTKNQKTKILVYCHDWFEGGLAANLTNLMINLHPQYEFILVYCGERSCDLPEKISSICFNQVDSKYVSTYLALLAELLDVNIYWANAANFLLPNAISVSYLMDSRIRTIASFHFIEPTANLFSTILNEDAWRIPLSETSIITHEQHDLMCTQYLYPYDAVLLPPLGRDMESCEKWHKFFQAILFLGNYKEQMRECFPLIAHMSDDSVFPLEVAQIIQSYLEKYQKYTLEKQRKYYEQSVYWRITKPLRMTCDLFRKIV